MTKRENFLRALMIQPTMKKAYESAKISKSTAYKLLKDESFQNELAKLKAQAMSEAVTFLQGNLSQCSEVLMDIVTNEKIGAQVRINAINSVFTNCKMLTESVEIGRAHV